MNSPKNSHANILTTVQDLTSGVKFTTDTAFSWSPETKTITYKSDSLNDTEGKWSLLHEVAHATLAHHIYKTDFELLTLEVAAWEHAKKLAGQLDLEIDENYVQDCLDTYRDWLHRRSTCPTCGSTGLQHNTSEYRCHNCHTVWRVSAARFCRPYRRKEMSSEAKSPDVAKKGTTFR